MEMKLIHDSVRQRWELTDVLKAKVLARLEDVILNEEASTKDIIAATKVFIDMDKVNVAHGKLLKELTFDELREELRLRIEEEQLKSDRKVMRIEQQE